MTRTETDAMTRAPSDSANSASDHWSDYWRHGSLTTFFSGEFQTGYAGPVAEFWEAEFERLPDRAIIVDLATGNGAIPYIAAGVSNRRAADMRIIGFDYADIRLPDDAAARQQMASIELYPNTPMEATGLDAGSVDLVTSHFGLEYGDQAQAIDEIARLLVPGGRLALVMHHPDSAVVRQAHRDYRQTRMCLDEERLDRKVRDLVRIVGDARTPEQRARLQHNRDAEKLRGQINRSMQRLLDRIEGDEDDSQMFRVAQSFLRVFADLVDRSKQEKLDFIENSSRSLSAYAGRMEAMARATLDEAAFERFIAALDAAGFTVAEPGVLSSAEGELLGRVVTATLVRGKGKE